MGRIAWNKLYKRELFDSIRYPVGKNYEDACIICDLLEKSNIVSYTLEPLYFHVIRNDSITHTFSLKNFEDMIYSDDVIIRFLETKGYYDLVLKEKNKKYLRIIDGLARFRLMRIGNKEIYDRYYVDLINGANSMSWKESSFKIKLFKVLWRGYICWRMVKIGVNEWGKKIYSHL